MKKILILITGILLLYGCKKQESLPTDPIIALGGYSYTSNDLDKFIYDNFTYPYNIEVKYRWEPSEINFTKSIAPVKQDKVKDILQVISKGWISPYKAVAGENFLRIYNFSKFYLAGSWEYRSDGSILLGSAEGGVRIVILGVNDVDRTDVSNFQEYLYTIHHEFAHIIHQTRFFPQEWRNIAGNSQYFTATWNNTSTADAQKQGFVRNYAKLNMNEDFVETIAFLLVRGQNKYDDLKVKNPAVANVFKQKEDIIVNYYKDVLRIDFRKLQDEVQNALIEIKNL